MRTPFGEVGDTDTWKHVAPLCRVAFVQSSVTIRAASSTSSARPQSPSVSATSWREVRTLCGCVAKRTETPPTTVLASVMRRCWHAATVDAAFRPSRAAATPVRRRRSLPRYDVPPVPRRHGRRRREAEFARDEDALSYAVDEDGPEGEVQRVEYLGAEGDWRWAGALRG